MEDRKAARLKSEIDFLACGFIIVIISSKKKGIPVSETLSGHPRSPQKNNCKLKTFLIYSYVDALLGYDRGRPLGPLVAGGSRGPIQSLFTFLVESHLYPEVFLYLPSYQGPYPNASECREEVSSLPQTSRQ